MKFQIKSNFLYKTTLFLLVIVLFLIKPKSRTGTLDIPLIYFVISAISLFIHFKLRRSNNWFSLDIVFLLGFLIVHYQWPIMIKLSNIEPDVFQRSTSYLSYIAYGTWISTLGLVSWILGFHVLNKSKENQNNIVRQKISYKKLLLFTYFAFIMFIMFAGSDYLRGNAYRGISGTATASGIGRYFQVIFLISVILVSFIVHFNMEGIKNGRIKLLNINKYVLFLLLGSILLFLLIGDRGGAVQITIANLIFIGVFARPIKIKEVIAISLAGMIVLTVIGLGRGKNESGNIFITGLKRFEVSSAYDFTIELANSARTLYSAISYVDYRPLFYGQLWVGDITSIFPLGKNIFLSVTDLESYQIDSAEYLTYQAFGKNHRSGEGTSLIADIYLNFGYFGVFLFMSLLGLFVKKMLNEMFLNKSLIWLCAAAIFSSIVLYISRGSLFFMLKPIVWSILILYFFTDIKQKLQISKKNTINQK